MAEEKILAEMSGLKFQGNYLIWQKLRKFSEEKRLSTRVAAQTILRDERVK